MKIRHALFFLYLFFVPPCFANDLPDKPEPQPFTLNVQSEPAPAGRVVNRPFWKDRPVMELAALHVTTGSYDWIQTRVILTHGGWEVDPLAKPFVGNSVVLALVATGEVMSTAYVAEKMRSSPHAILRKTWWIPQTAAIAGHLGAGIYSTSMRNVKR